MDKKRAEHKKFSRRLLWLPLFLLLAASLACDIPISQLISGNADTPTAQPPQSSGAKEGSDNGSLASPTNTLLPDTATFTPSPTATLTPTITLTPTPYLIISQNTNCRTGPGSVYDLLFTYLSGSQPLLMGKLADETFFYAQDDNGVNPDGWVLAKFATPVGDLSGVPVMTPPPTPTPFLNFTASYEGSDCGAGSCGLWIRIDNIGTMPLESVKVYAQNTVTSADSTYKSNLFQTGIMGSDIASVLVASSGYTHSSLLPNPSGAKVSITVKACSQNDMNGVCLTRNLTANP